MELPDGAAGKSVPLRFGGALICYIKSSLYRMLSGARECFSIKVMHAEFDFAWAFSLGCSLYVTNGLLKILNDQEVKAVLAHEMTHGDHGHMVKLLESFSASSSVFIETLVFEELNRWYTGEVGECTKQIMADSSKNIPAQDDKFFKVLPYVLHGELNTFLDIHGASAPDDEIDADVGAVKIMKRAHMDPNNLISALLKLTGEDSIESMNPSMATQDSLRDYPSLMARIQAIQNATRAP